MIQLGQHPAPTHTIAHFSDPHFLAGDRQLFGAVDTHAHLLQALAQLERSGSMPDAIVFTGDLADLGEPDAYRQLRSLVEPAAERMGTRVIWVMGNHDEREAFRRELLGEEASHAHIDRVDDLGGLRVISLDTSVPGYHHGEISDAQLEWLAGVLEVEAPLGSILAMHHPPIPTPVEVMAILELQRQKRLADVLRGTDVRAILAGHLHYSTHSTFAGIPVSVSAATCYTLDLSAPPHQFSGVDRGQAFTLVGVYEDRVVHSIVPLGEGAQVSGFSDLFLRNIASMSPEDRLEAFSSKRSPYSIEDIERRSS